MGTTDREPLGFETKEWFVDAMCEGLCDLARYQSDWKEQNAYRNMARICERQRWPYVQRSLLNWGEEESVLETAERKGRGAAVKAALKRIAKRVAGRLPIVNLVWSKELGVDSSEVLMSHWLHTGDEVRSAVREIMTRSAPSDADLDRIARVIEDFGWDH